MNDASSTTASTEPHANGVCVVRGAVPYGLVTAALSDVTSHLDYMLSLPGRSYGTRHFLRYNPHEKLKQKECTQRSDFVPEWTKNHAKVLESMLDGKVGDIITYVLGGPPVLTEITAIIAAPGTNAQTLHSDSNFEATAWRAVTCFSLHDILEEWRGPTRFCPNTHMPACFRHGNWLPPPDGHYRHPMQYATSKKVKNSGFRFVLVTVCAWTTAVGMLAVLM